MTRWPRITAARIDERGKVVLRLACDHEAKPDLTDYWAKRPHELVDGTRRYPCPLGCSDPHGTPEPEPPPRAA